MSDLDDCNYSDDNEELFPSPSVDRADLFDPINNSKANGQIKDWMRDGAEKINIDGTHKQSCRKREGNLDGDIYHYILNSNLTDDMQNSNEHNKGTPHTFTGFDKTLSNQRQHPNSNTVPICL